MQESEILFLFDAHHNAIYRLALSYTRSSQDAEDVVQQTFLRLLETQHPPKRGHEKPWLMQVAVNLCRDLLRTPSRRTQPLDETLPAPQDGELWRAVQALPDDYRAAIHLHYYEGYTLAEIAKLLHLSVSGVSMRLHRARKQLQSSLTEEDYHGIQIQRTHG